MDESLPPVVRALRALISERNTNITALAAEVGMTRTALAARLNSQLPLDVARPGGQVLLGKLLAALEISPRDFAARVESLGSAIDSVDLMLEEFLRDDDPADVTFERLQLAIVYDCSRPGEEREAARQQLSSFYNDKPSPRAGDRRVLLTTLSDCQTAASLRRSIYRSLMLNPAALDSENRVTEPN